MGVRGCLWRGGRAQFGLLVRVAHGCARREIVVQRYLAELGDLVVGERQAKVGCELCEAVGHHIGVLRLAAARLHLQHRLVGRVELIDVCRHAIGFRHIDRKSAIALWTTPEGGALACGRFRLRWGGRRHAGPCSASRLLARDVSDVWRARCGQQIVTGSLLQFAAA